MRSQPGSGGTRGGLFHLPCGEWLATGERTVPPRLKTEPVRPPWGLGPSFPGRIPTRPSWAGREGLQRGSPGQARLPWAGPGSGVPKSCPDWAGRAQPGLIRAQSSASRSPGWADGAGLLPSLLLFPSLTQCRDLFAASPGIWGCRRGLGTRGGAGDSLEPGDRDKSPLSPSLLAEFSALSCSISLGKQNCPPQIPSSPRLQVKKARGN